MNSHKSSGVIHSARLFLESVESFASSSDFESIWMPHQFRFVTKTNKSYHISSSSSVSFIFARRKQSVIFAKMESLNSRELTTKMKRFSTEKIISQSIQLFYWIHSISRLIIFPFDDLLASDYLHHHHLIFIVGNSLGEAK